MPTPAGRDYITSTEAMRILGVRPQTLYAYVSRGLIRSVVQPGSKAKLYLNEDVQRTSSRSAARAGHAAVAASAMNWGEPIISTAITEITPKGPSYRGHLASGLVSRGLSFESAAELLWTGELPARAPRWAIASSTLDLAPVFTQLGGRLFSGRSGGNLLESFASVVLLLGLGRGSVEDRVRKGSTLAAARQIVQTLVGCCGFAGSAGRYVGMRRGDGVVAGLVRSLALEPTLQNAEALQAIMVLMADHELSPGTLSARVVASGGATLHSCVAAALCANSGLDAGRGYELVEAFLGEPRSAAVLVKKALRYAAAGQAVPGFHHPLYPAGDPRALELLELARRRKAPDAGARAVLRFIDVMRETSQLHPRQELAVVLLTRMMGLPTPVSTGLFALARIAGLVAHVIEQRERGTLLRPRARFEHVG